MLSNIVYGGQKIAATLWMTTVRRRISFVNQVSTWDVMGEVGLGSQLARCQ